MKKRIFILFTIVLTAATAVAQDVQSMLETLEKRYGCKVEPTLSDGHSIYIIRARNGVGVCDSSGREIIPIGRYTDARIETGGNHVWLDVCTDDRHGICDMSGKEILAPLFDVIYCYYDFFSVDKEGKTGVYGLDGSEIIAPGRFDAFLNRYGSEGLFCVSRDGKWGYVDMNGETIIPTEYDKASAFADGTARVTKGGKTTLLANPLRTDKQAHTPRPCSRAVSSYPAPHSDVDTDIPSGTEAPDNEFAFIIANENYPAAKVPYALNDGWIFEQYCKKTLGMADDHVMIFEDATGGNIMTCIEQIKSVAKAYDGEAKIIFYYAGHAFPDQEKSTAYLLPVDGDSSNSATGYSLARLYTELNSVPAKSIICIIDACFSGATRTDGMLLTGRGVAIKVKEDIPQGNIVVLTSATGAETAHQYEETGHGLFTYFLLQKLQQTKGDVTLGELTDHLYKNVRRKSVLINRKMQTPTVIPSPALAGSWRNIRL